jgi:hypothetical protein
MHYKRQINLFLGLFNNAVLTAEIVKRRMIWEDYHAW